MEASSLPAVSFPSSLAERLEAQKDEIGRVFAAKVRAHVSGTKGYDFPTLLNHIPQFLDALIAHLRRERKPPIESVGEKRVSREHGAQRAALPAYTIEQILAEYRLMRKSIFEVLERDGAVPPAERDLLLDAIQLGAKSAASQFMHVRTSRLPAIRWLPATALARCLVSAALVAAATGLQFLLWPWLAPQAFIVYYPALIAAAVVGDGFLATALSLVAAWFFFLEPRYSFAIEGSGDVLQLVFFLFNGCAIAMITRSLGRAMMYAESSSREQETAKREVERAVQEMDKERDLREQFVATLTHDLRGPLTAVRTNLELATRSVEKRESLERYLQKAARGVIRTDKMIQDLLDVSRIRAGLSIPLEVEPCDLCDLAELTVEELRVSYEGDVRVSCRDPLRGHWSHSGMRRVLENLVTNGLKYGKRGAPVEVLLERAGDKAVLKVHNELAGAPLAEDELATIFEPYRRAAAAVAGGQKGWGLGLTIVRWIAEAHGGLVKAESGEGKGTTFRVVLPMGARPSRPPSDFP